MDLQQTSGKFQLWLLRAMGCCALRFQHLRIKELNPKLNKIQFGETFPEFNSTPHTSSVFWT